jgi:CSLREA domain-containing protein
MFQLSRHLKVFPMKKIFRLSIIMLFCAVLFVRPASAASTRYAAPSAVGSGDCSSWANACSLQTALTGASSGDTIWIKAGTYYPTSGTDRAISFVLKTGVSAYGGFAGTETHLDQRDPSANPTILSGDIGTVADNSDNSYHVVVGSGTNSTAVLDGVTVTAGNADGSGNQGTGGGIYNNDGSPTISNVTLSNNSAGQGGGIYNNHTSTGSSPTLTNVTFDSNSASYGGGLYNLANSNAILTNVTFYNNHASPRGGAIYNNNSTPVLTNVTFGANTAPGGGSAIYLDYGNPIIQDSIFWGSGLTVGNESAIISDTIVQGGCPAGVTCNNVLNVDPLLGPLQNNGGDTPTMALGVGSPAIDAGNDATCASTDQRGISRPQGSHCDMGAYEVQEQAGPDFVVNMTADTDDGYCTEVDCTLREAINAANSYSGTATISFASADFSTPQIITLTSTLPSITNAIIINGPGSNLLTVDGDKTYRVFDAESGSDLTLDGLTIAHGYHSGPGGGVFVGQGNVTILNSTFFSNTATTRGGGIYFNGGGTLAISNTILLSNKADNSGGAIGVRSGTATLTNTTLSNNLAAFGGGIYNWDTLNVISSTLSNNSTTTNGGGGIYNQGFVLEVADSVFSGNTSIFGGGIATITGTMTVSNSTFSGNVAVGTTGGGGIYSQGSGTTLAVFGSTFDSNVADDHNGHGFGGGLAVGSSVITATVAGSTFFGNSTGAEGGGISTFRPLTVTNSTFYGNSASTDGGGIDSRSGATTTVNNSTFSGNSASNNGGGDISVDGGSLNLNNNIVANSTNGGDCRRIAGTINAQNSLIEDGLNCVNGTNSNNLTGDPLLGALADNGGSTQTMALLPGSPAIDAGDDSICADAATVNDLDQRGVARPQGSHCDIGAFESRGFTLAKSSGDNQSTVINTAFSAPLEVTVTSAYSEPTSGGSVTFVGPLSGAGIVPITTTATIAGGLATANVTANGIGGSYPVSVSANGASPSQTFNLTNTYLITPTAGAHGTITPDTPQMVNYGDSITFTVAADTGYHIADVGVDGASQGAVSAYTFDNVTANHTISATFAIDTFVITPTAGLNGSITPDTPQTLNYGDSITFTVAADTGYHIADVGVDGASQGAVGGYTFDNVTANHTISATFAIDTFVITPTAGLNGSITPDSPQTLNYGDSITFTIAADTGYHIADVGVDGASQGPISSYTFDNVTANHTITATFATNTYTLTVATSGIGSGVVTPTIGVHTYTYGTVVTITQAADPVSYFSGWSGDCSGQGTCAVTMTENRSVVANFDQHRIYVPLAAGGS